MDKGPCAAITAQTSNSRGQDWPGAGCWVLAASDYRKKKPLVHRSRPPARLNHQNHQRNTASLTLTLTRKMAGACYGRFVANLLLDTVEFDARTHTAERRPPLPEDWPSFLTMKTG